MKTDLRQEVSTLKALMKAINYDSRLLLNFQLVQLKWNIGPFRNHDCFDINCACFAYALRASDERTEPEAESKAEAVDSKRATLSLHSLFGRHIIEMCISKLLPTSL